MTKIFIDIFMYLFEFLMVFIILIYYLVKRKIENQNCYVFIKYNVSRMCIST